MQHTVLQKNMQHTVLQKNMQHTVLQKTQYTILQNQQHLVLQKNRLSGIFRGRPPYLAAICKSDCQSDLHLADYHADSQRAKKHAAYSAIKHAAPGIVRHTPSTNSRQALREDGVRKEKLKNKQSC
jgi:hypothetical protein